jgi:hypothetical protein
VPAYVVSPFVQVRTVSHAQLDHTSVLKFLGQKFGGGSYSVEVDNRAVRSIADVLNLNSPRTDMPAAPPLQGYLAARPKGAPVVSAPPPKTPLQQAFRDATRRMKQHGAGPSHPKFGALLKHL